VKRVVILASGSGTLAQAIFDARTTTLAELDIVAVISDKKDAQVIDRAEAAQIESYVVPMMADRTQWDRELETLLGALKPDLVVSAGFMRLLSSRTVEKFKIINSHPSLLPLFPGAHAVRDALQAGATQSGTTIHWVDAGLDTGEVIAQERCDIRSDDTEESLHERIKILERGLLVATIASILALQENKNG
jgi:phosphoribosylglycinamide formyltransferase-1